MCLIYYAQDMLLRSSSIGTYEIFLQCTRGSISEVLNDKESQMIPSFLISIPPFNPQQLMEQTPLFTNIQGHGYSLVNIYSSKKKKFTTNYRKSWASQSNGFLSMIISFTVSLFL